MIHSHLAYCINIYGCASATVLNKLIVKQKDAIRVVSLGVSEVSRKNKKGGVIIPDDNIT